MHEIFFRKFTKSRAQLPRGHDMLVTYVYRSSIQYLYSTKGSTAVYTAVDLSGCVRAPFRGIGGVHKHFGDFILENTMQ
jgi:hypothetical protein